jgi:uncharacterized membrane protein YesL
MINDNLRDKLVDTYVFVIPLVTLNLLWLLSSLPLVTCFPAVGGLFYATNQLAHGLPADRRTFIEGFRLYAGASFRWGVLNLLVAATLLSNIVFYSLYTATWSFLARGMLVVVGAVWAILQLYMFPLLLEQAQPSLRLALRNSLALALKRPLYSIGLTLLAAAVILISTLLVYPAWFFITASFCAYLANAATVASLARDK